MTFFRVGFLNSLSVALKLASMLAFNKLLALYVGPGGYAVIGQFQSVLQTITGFGNGAIYNGVTKLTSEFNSDPARQRVVWRTAGTIFFLLSLAAAVALVIFSNTLSFLLFGRDSYFVAFSALGLCIIFINTNFFILAIMNGLNSLYRLILCNSLSTILFFFVSTGLLINWGLLGAMVGLVLHQALSLLVALLLCWSRPWFHISSFVGRVDRISAMALGKMALIALTSSLCAPLSQILVRNQLGAEVGWTAAGYWDAISRLSSAYLMFVTSALSVYFIPRISPLTCGFSIWKEILSVLNAVVPIVAVVGFFCFLLRDIVIVWLFSDDFLPMRDLFMWQMIGDTFKVAGWVFAYVMIGRAWTWTFIFCELAFNISFVIMTSLLISRFGLNSVPFAHAVCYGFYVIFTLFIVRRRLLGAIY